MPEIKVEVVFADGFGFGQETGISALDRTDVEKETLKQVEAIIQSPDILVKVDDDKQGQMIDDDGCPDGRFWKRIFEGGRERYRSLNRPKVFGGGVAMAAASIIGLGRTTGMSLKEVFITGIKKLKDNGLNFGAHTDEHSHGPNCGCGALDKAPEIVNNVAKFEEQIRDSIDHLDLNTDGLEDVFDNYRNYSVEIKDEPYAGAVVAEKIKDEGKVVKELGGKHLEMFVVLNTVKGFTVNQELVRALSGGKIQVFGIDVWRMQELANDLYPDEGETIKNQAFLSELVYSLGVSGTLTKGDLPVYLVAPQPQLVAA